MKFPVLILLSVFFINCSGQQAADTLQLHFLYGSVPAQGYKKTEPKLFGGIKGGHVNIELNGKVLDFVPGNCPILPENKKPTGGFQLNKAVYWDTSTSKWATISIPITAEQVQKLDTIFALYPQQTPYDYAVFGMRCAAASYDVLSEIGLMKKLTEKDNIIANFYPKLLRKRLLKWAKENNYTVVYHQGRPTRKWESDDGVF